MIHAPSICSQQLLHELMTHEPRHYTRGMGYQRPAASTGFCEVAIASKAGESQSGTEKASSLMLSQPPAALHPQTLFPLVPVPCRLQPL